MKNVPLVSIVMTAYNSERYICQTLKSILNQKYRNIEIIVILEYGITDNTERITRRVCKGDRRVIVVKNSRRLGIAASRNEGFKLASGKYIALIDSDDIMFRNRISVQVEYMEKNKDVILCGADVLYINDKNKVIGYNHTMTSANDIRMGMLKEYPITSPTIFLRSDVLKKNNWFQPTDEHSEDMAWLSYFVFNGKVCNIPTILGCYRLSKTSATRASGRNLAAESLYRIREKICANKNIAYTDDAFRDGRKIKTEKCLIKSEEFIKECIAKGLIDSNCDEFNYRLYQEAGRGLYSTVYRMWKNIYQKKESLLRISLNCCKYEFVGKMLWLFFKLGGAKYDN